MTRAPTTEAAILADILVAVSDLREGFFWRNNSGALPNRQGRMVTFGLIGSGDILGAHCGRAVAIEVKSEAGRQHISQQRFQAAWERAGGIYIIARSVDDVMAVLAPDRVRQAVLV
jgi:hypothetical protein